MTAAHELPEGGGRVAEESEPDRVSSAPPGDAESRERLDPLAATTPATEHQFAREYLGEAVRVVCSCGHRGKWRRAHEGRGLRSDESAHAHAVRRAKAAQP